MKKVYWQPHYFGRYSLVLICILGLFGLWMVEHFKQSVPEQFYQQKLAAAQLAQDAMQTIKNYRIKKKIPIDSTRDPQKSGFIGQANTSTASAKNSLIAKQTSINPNLAALVVEWLKQAGLKKGDTVAITLTGSLPALNIAVLSAVKTLELKPLIIVHAASTQWGANLTKLSWPIMQRVLIKQNKLTDQPIAVIKKNTRESVEKRMDLFKTAADRQPIKAYISIGNIRDNLPSGLIQDLPIALAETNSIMVHFLKMGVPVINLKNITKIAQQNGFPVAPATPPSVGKGKPFFRQQYNIYLALGQLLVIVGCLIFVSVRNKKLFNRKYQLD
jgi:hypothetical protein